MALDWETKYTANGVEEVYSWDEEDPKATRRLVFRIDAAKKKVRFFPRDNFPAKSILFDGFKAIPTELNRNGYIKTGGVQYYLGKKLSSIGVNQVTVTRTATKKLAKTSTGYRLTITYEKFQDLVDRFKRITANAQAGRQIEIDRIFHSLFPRKCNAPSIAASQRVGQLISGLDDGVIKDLDASQVDRVLDFTKTILEKKYASDKKRRELFGAAKLKVDDVALTQVIDQFVHLMESKQSESKWGTFLRKNLFLVESRYIHVIEQLNVVLGGSRKVDFGLVDTAGFLDLFEIKVPPEREARSR